MQISKPAPKQSTNHRRQPVESEEDTHSGEFFFRASEEHTHNGYESGEIARFEYAEDKVEGDDFGVFMSSDVAKLEDELDEDRGSCEF